MPLRPVHPLRSFRFLAAACCLAVPALAAAQTNLPPELMEQLKKMQNSQPGGDGIKGWTCRDREDGKRLHMVDTTGKRSMHGVPSSVAGFNDNATPVASLPLCDLPR